MLRKSKGSIQSQPQLRQHATADISAQGPPRGSVVTCGPRQMQGATWWRTLSWKLAHRKSTRISMRARQFGASQKQTQRALSETWFCRRNVFCTDSHLGGALGCEAGAEGNNQMSPIPLSDRRQNAAGLVSQGDTVVVGKPGASVMEKTCCSPHSP